MVLVPYRIISRISANLALCRPADAQVTNLRSILKANGDCRSSAALHEPINPFNILRRPRSSRSSSTDRVPSFWLGICPLSRHSDPRFRQGQEPFPLSGLDVSLLHGKWVWLLRREQIVIIFPSPSNLLKNSRTRQTSRRLHSIGFESRST